MSQTGIELNEWSKSSIQVFWGEIAPHDHLVQIYENDIVFLNTLEGFIGDGFLKNESVIIIATTPHIEILKSRLKVQGFDIDSLIAKDQFITVDADTCIKQFFVDEWPDEELFTKCVSALLLRAQKNGRKVRAFGEMVALLWEKGLNGATIRLEALWHEFQNKNPFCLYCAYPKSGFTQDAASSIDCICKAHSKVIDGSARPSTELYYKHVSELTDCK